MTQIQQAKRVAIYTGYSTDMQNPKSIDDQVRECRRHILREGWSEVEVFSDMALSGATNKRPGFDALKVAVRQHKFDVVLFEHIDRVARDLEFLMSFYKEARYADTELHQLHRGKLGIFDIGILGTFAQVFLEELGFKTRRGLAGKIEEGKSAGGLSYGYKVRKTEAGEPIKRELSIDADEQKIIQRIFREYAAGKSPHKIAVDLNAEGVPAPRGRSKGTGHWMQNTIYGNRSRGTGILNNELYVGRRVWNRLRYSKHPETGKRVSRQNPQEEWTIAEVPDLRLMEDSLWDAVKARQTVIDATRSKAEAANKTGAGASQSARRRKYLLSGLLTCGACGGNLTVAGQGDRRRYYCANARQKGDTVCAGMPGLKESDAAEILLGCLRNGLMQDDAYEDFRKSFVSKLRAEEERNQEPLRRHDQKIRELEKTHGNLVTAVGEGKYSDALITHLNKVDAELMELRQMRGQMLPTPIELPADIPALYRAYVENLTDTLMDEDVSGSVADELANLLERVVVTWEGDQQMHELAVEGKLLEMLIKAKPADEAGFVGNACFLKLVAGA